MEPNLEQLRPANPMNSLDLINEVIEDGVVLANQYKILVKDNLDIQPDYKKNITVSDFQEALEVMREGFELSKSARVGGQEMGEDAIPKNLIWKFNLGKNHNNFRIGMLDHDTLGVSGALVSIFAHDLKYNYPLYYPTLKSWFHPKDFIKLIMIEECCHRYDMSVLGHRFENTVKNPKHELELRAREVVIEQARILGIQALSEDEVKSAKSRYSI